MKPAKTKISMHICTVWSALITCLLQPPSYPKRDKQKPLPYWMDVDADLSLCWLHRSYCRFCHELAHILWVFISRQFTWNTSLIIPPATCVCGVGWDTRCPSVYRFVMFWFLLLIVLNNFRNLFIFCVNIDIDELLLDKNKDQWIKSFRVISLCNFWKGVLISASYLAK